jgi:hypothetical protein
MKFGNKMNAMKSIAQSNRLRSVLGGAICGAVNFGIFHGNTDIAFVAVPISVLVGAFWCISPERFVLCLLQCAIAGACLVFGYSIISKIMAHDYQWWAIAPVSILLGAMGGVAVGSLFGGVCRHYSESITHSNDGISSNNQ